MTDAPDFPQPHPKSLILNLLLAAKGSAMSSRSLVGAATLFGISENSIRVTLVRLTAAGLITSAGRGRYVPGPQATALTSDLSRWRTKEDRACEWSGDWLMVSTGAAGRSDRTALRLRERALSLVGFMPLDDTLFARPDNLVGGTPGVRQRLHALGLETDIPVYRASDLSPALEARARALWDGAALNARYQQTEQRLVQWIATASQQPLAVAARDAYLIGNAAIRQLVFDPLLPEPLVNVQWRRSFTQAVLKEEALGQTIWQELLRRLGAGDIGMADLREVSPVQASLAVKGEASIASAHEDRTPRSALPA